MYRIDNKKNVKAHQARRRALIQEFKKCPCQDCGGTFPVECMDFDHRDKSTKVMNVASMTTCAWHRVLAEINKCDVVCANCHRIRTHSAVT